MRVLILGAGRIGMSVGKRLRGLGHQVIGVRRKDPGLEPVMPMVFGDLADPVTYKPIPGAFDAILLCATPGVRRGKDNGLGRGAKLIADKWGSARVVYTGTSAVYADLQGGDADEDSPLAETDDNDALLAIEDGLLAIENTLILRCAALLGPRYAESRNRVRMAGQIGEVIIRGDPNRPFSYLHERDLIDIVCDAIQGGFGCGILNASSPLRRSYADSYRVLVQKLGQMNKVVGDGQEIPSRRINASRLWGAYPGRQWRTPFDEEVSAVRDPRKQRSSATIPAAAPADGAGLTGVYRKTGEVNEVDSDAAAGGLTGVFTNKPKPPPAKP